MSDRTKHFTNDLIRKLKHDPRTKASATEYSDDETKGLKIEVSASGSKVFYFRYTIHKKKRAKRLGTFPAMLVADARKDALAARAKVDAGEDPQEEARISKATPTLAEFADEYYLPWAMKRKKSWEDDVSRLKHHLLPTLGARRMDHIGVRDVEKLVADLLVQKLSPSTCNRVLHLLSAMFRKAMEYGIVNKNPCAAVKPLKENNMRRRYLAQEEMARFLAAAKKDSNQSASLLFEFLLATGARREEGAQAKWCDIDFGRKEWLIPKTKNGMARYVPLNPAALAALNRVPKVSGNPYIFTGKLPGRPLHNPTKAFKRILERAGITNLRIHDLRHSFASMAVNGGATLYAVQHLLGHRNPKTTERYAHLSTDALQEASGQVAKAVQSASGQVPPAAAAPVAPSVAP